MAVAEEIRREFQTGFRGECTGVARDRGPTADVVDEDESTPWLKGSFQDAQGFRNILKMVEGGMADDAVEGLVQSEMIRISTPIVNVWGGPSGAGNGEHRFRDIDGDDRGEVTGKQVREDAGSATDIEDPLATFGKMLQEERGTSLPGGDEVVFFGEMVEGAGVMGFRDSGLPGG